MISPSDVTFLRTLSTNLAKGYLKSFLPSRRRSTAALILRFNDDDSKKVSKLFSRFDANISAHEAINRLERNQDGPDTPGSLELLFLKRADIRDDRWSGRIAFPGGFRDTDDRSDMDCLVREVYDEIGFPLRTPDFVYLGKMEDYSLQSRVVSRTGIVQSRFVFLHVGELTPSVRINEYHVESMQWVSLNQIQRADIDKRAVMHAATKFVTARNNSADQDWMQQMVTCDVFFPSIKLPGKWRIWGLTFYNTTELMELAGQKCLCWPLFNVSTPALRVLVYALHGYWELMDPRKPSVEKHKLCLCLMVALSFYLLYYVCDCLWQFGIWVRTFALMERTRRLGRAPNAAPQPVELPEELPELPVEYDSSIDLIR